MTDLTDLAIDVIMDVRTGMSEDVAIQSVAEDYDVDPEALRRAYNEMKNEL
jgi:hypothetical protein